MILLIKTAFKFKFETSNRIVGLDIFRTVAILFVLFAHFLTVLPDNFFLFDFLFNFSGYIGVELFFVLSGFLIGSILIKINNQSDDFTFKVMQQFWIRRWFRTLPNYYLLLMVNVVIYYVGTHQNILNSLDGWLHFLFLQNFCNKQLRFFDESWSLCIEEWFYLLIPLFIYVFRRMRRNNKRQFIFAVLTFYFLILILKFGTIWHYNFSWGEIRKITPIRLSSILYGVIAAFICFYNKKQWITQKNIYLSIGIILVAINTYLYFIYIFDCTSTKQSFGIRFFLFDLFSISFALLLPFFSQIKQIKNKTLESFFVFISTISYSLYLIHIPVLRLLSVFKFSYLFYYVLCWVVTILISTILYNLYEYPFTLMREKFSRKKLSEH